MCTVTWLHTGDTYHMLSNRDERRTRGAALGPAVERRDGVRFIAPVDADRGGAWIGANEFGVSVSLLNGNAPAAVDGHPLISRGLIVREVLDSRTAMEATLRLLDMDLGTYAAFKLVALDPVSPASAFLWDGREKAIVADANTLRPLTSSSFDPAGVEAHRRAVFVDQVERSRAVDLQALYRYHTAHTTEADAYSTCMHRPDAETVSFSRITVTREEVQFFYSPASPCKAIPSHVVRLPRRS